MKVINVVGARPNFMKVAPLHNAIPPFWDGEAANRVAKIIDNGFQEKVNTERAHENRKINV